MNIIKLDAIDSTSVFLKELSKNESLQNFTAVAADEQYQGKGQHNTQWHSAKGANLLFTIYVDLKGLLVDDLPFVNFLVATKLREVLIAFLGENNRIQIKWPNDILSYKKKVAGILVENSLQGNQVSNMFIGIGLNVNQTAFSDAIPNATSMCKITGQQYDRDILLAQILNAFKKVLNVTYILNNKKRIKEAYLSSLYKKNTPSMFQDNKGSAFMGIVKNVSDSGLLQIEKEDEQIYEYAVKEVKFL